MVKDKMQGAPGVGALIIVKHSKKLKVGDKIVGKILNVCSQEVFVTSGTLHSQLCLEVFPKHSENAHFCWVQVFMPYSF